MNENLDTDIKEIKQKLKIQEQINQELLELLKMVEPFYKERHDKIINLIKIYNEIGDKHGQFNG